MFGRMWEKKQAGGLPMARGVRQLALWPGQSHFVGSVGQKASQPGSQAPGRSRDPGGHGRRQSSMLVTGLLKTLLVQHRLVEGGLLGQGLTDN